MPRGLLALFLLVSAGSRAGAAEAPRDVRDAVVARAQALFDALGTDRADVWERTLTEDAVIIDEVGRRQGKAEAVKGVRPFPQGFSGSIEIRDPHAILRGDTAVLDCEAYEQESVHGQKLVVRYRGTFTFVREAGAWKVAAITTVTIPTAPAALEVRDLRPAEYGGTYRWGPGRAWVVSSDGKRVLLAPHEGAPAVALEPLARDVFMSGDDERNLYIFRRGASGRIEELIERRKFNDLHARREDAVR